MLNITTFFHTAPNDFGRAAAIPVLASLLIAVPLQLTVILTTIERSPYLSNSEGRWRINIDTPLLRRFEAEFEHWPPPMGVRTPPPERSSPHSHLKIGFMHQRHSEARLSSEAILSAFAVSKRRSAPIPQEICYAWR